MLADRDEWVYRDYENVTRGYIALEQERAARQDRGCDLEERLAEALRERDALPYARRAAPAERRGRQARLSAELAAHEARNRAAGELSLVAGAAVAPPAERVARASRRLAP